MAKPKAAHGMPADVLEIRSRYVAAFPLWTMPSSPAAEDRARAWTIGLCEQIAFEKPAQGWGSKRADGGRPISKDAVAQLVATSPQKLFCWDQMIGAGSGSPQLVPDPDAIDISDQVFVVVPPVDHLSGDVAPVPPEPIVPDVIPYDDEKAVQFGLACNDVYTECGQPIDPGMISVYSQRCAWDYYVGGLSWDDAFDKQINAFRAVYGLPPI